MGNYIFLNRSNLSNAADLSAWHVEAIPLTNNMLKDRDRAKSEVTEIQKF